MKKLFLCALFLLSSNSLFAENSKMIKVDLDVNSTVIVKADLDQDDLYYYIDKTACLCFFYRIGSSGPALATVPCEALKAHKKLQKHLAKCEAPKPVVAKKIVAPAPVEVPDALKMDDDVPAPTEEKKPEEKKVEEPKKS